MNIIKRHKGLALVGGLTLILILVMFAIFARMIFSNGDSEYGERLNDIKKLDQDIPEEIIKETKELNEVDNLTIRVQGKIIYTTIYFKEGTKKDKAKEIANNTLKKYDEEIMRDYDFGYFLKENVKEVEVKEGEEPKKGFNIAGTKHPETDKISWTK